MLPAVLRGGAARRAHRLGDEQRTDLVEAVRAREEPLPGRVRKDADAGVDAAVAVVDEAVEFIADVARKHGLVAFDPQAEEVIT